MRKQDGASEQDRNDWPTGGRGRSPGELGLRLRQAAKPRLGAGEATRTDHSAQSRISLDGNTEALCLFTLNISGP